jgi:purine-binding chemotaxis protein CheW
MQGNSCVFLGKSTYGYPMTPHQKMVVVAVDGRRIALPLAAVVRIVWAVEITPWPDSPPGLLGVINVQGNVIPVHSLRYPFGRADRDVELEDQMVIVRSGQRTAALLVDEVSGVVECGPQHVAAAETVQSGDNCIQAVVKLGGELALVPDIERLLSTTGP